MQHERWPSLHLADWEPTYLTLHRWTQIVGKVRLACEPPLHHWWHVPLFVTARGLTTLAMPCGETDLTITFDFASHRLVAETSDKRVASFALEAMAVAEFYRRVEELLRSLHLQVHLWPVPVEVADRTPFDQDRRPGSYDPGAVERLHRILLSVNRVFDVHRGRFLGKTSSVNFYWGSFDLAVTRFSGRRNPAPPTDRIGREAYSHEVVSHGFWPGGDWLGRKRVDDPVFYAYALPEPPGFRGAVVRPREARYDTDLGEFLLPYEVVRQASNPEALLLDFMETTYRAAADRAPWEEDAPMASMA